MLKKEGVIEQEQLESVTPAAKRLKLGGIAITECFQNIPCNPCYISCKRGAMRVMENINDLPQVDADVCNGCAICVSNCPGLAIFVVDGSYSNDVGTVKLPYEFLPLPQVGDIVLGLDRRGNFICDAKVLRTVNAPSQDKTAVVWLEVPQKYLMQVRFFKIKEQYTGQEQLTAATQTIKENLSAEESGLAEEEIIVCRCEGITLKQIRDCIKKGLKTVDEIKRATRAGMGPCSGRTCRQIIQGEIAKMTGVKVSDQPLPTFRAPSTPIRMELLAAEEEDE